MRQLAKMICLSGLLLSAGSNAVELDGSANYAFAVFVGTGKYRIGDRDIFVLRAPIAFTLKEADFTTKQIGYKLLVPAAVGVTNYDDINDIPDLSVADLQSMSVVPGLEAQIPVMQNWEIKPFGQAGLGWDMQSSSNSFVWGAGARTRSWFQENQKWLLGGEFLWAGNDPKHADEEGTSFTRWAIGTEYKWQTNWAPLFDRRLSWHVRLIGWWYANDLEFVPPPERTEIRNTVELGLSFGIDRPINILGYKFRQGGIGYEYGDNIKGIKFFTTFPF